MSIPEQLNIIVQIFESGGESDSYIDAVKYIHKMIIEDKEDGSFDKEVYFESAISIHNKLRSKYNADFNGPLLHWYRRFIGLYEDKE